MLSPAAVITLMLPLDDGHRHAVTTSSHAYNAAPIVVLITSMAVYGLLRCCRHDIDADAAAADAAAMLRARLLLITRMPARCLRCR